MSRILLGVVCGLVFGAIDIAIMLPMSFPDKRAAIQRHSLRALGSDLQSALLVFHGPDGWLAWCSDYC